MKLERNDAAKARVLREEYAIMSSVRFSSLLGDEKLSMPPLGGVHHEPNVALYFAEEEPIPVELERVELLAAEQEEVDQVLALTNTDKATDVLLARESLIC
ncbi:hypothetical protein L3X38_026471 [Prunus dulcis]|uniref:Uncharacterized protein n=1 Tax=Prunus dulcis TaxID=3755 RepID=A0AAD4VL11_PRUDU|nr:hypothetical protein L3X38_026471 [Prunus dulcis]